MTNLSARYRFIRNCDVQAIRDHILWQYHNLTKNDQRTEYTGIGPVTQSSAAASMHSVQVMCLQDIKLATRALQRRAAQLRTSTQKEPHTV